MTRFSRRGNRDHGQEDLDQPHHARRNPGHGPHRPWAAGDAGFRPGRTLRGDDGRTEPGGPAKCRSVPGGFCVSAYAARACGFDITICDIKTHVEGGRLASQGSISTSGRGGRRNLPWVFTEHGVAMLSSVLRSPKAVRVNIEIMRTFVRLRRLMATPGELVEQLTRLAETVQSHDGQIKTIVQVLNKMMERPEEPKTPDRVSRPGGRAGMISQGEGGHDR